MLDLCLFFTYYLPMVKRPLTRRQLLVLNFIRKQLSSEGVSPTLAEISSHFGFSSTASAQKYVNILVEKGFLLKEKNRSRSLIPVDDEIDGRICVLGTVAAGSPIESDQSGEEVSVPPEWIGDGDHFVLRVRGESMIGEGIHDGDLVLVKKSDRVRDGELVIASIDGEATIKRFFRHDGGRIRLQPANPEMKARIVPQSMLVIEGIVCGLLRRY